MNRLLLLVNALLALFLFVRAFATPSLAAPTTGPLAPREMRVEPDFGADGRVTALRVVLPAGFAADAKLGEVLDLGVRLDPPQALRTSWRDARTLLVAPQRQLPRARRYALAFAHDVHGAQGARIAAGTVLPFTTPAVRLLDALPTGAATEAAAVTVVFDLPVTLAAAQKHLRLLGAGKSVPFAASLASGGDSGTAVTLRPSADVDLGDDLRVQVLPGLTSVGSDVPVETAVDTEVALRQPLRLRGVMAFQGGIEVALNRTLEHVDPGAIRVTPAVPFQAMPSERGVRLLGEFPPATVVHVELQSGFPGVGDLRLAQSERRAVLMPERASELEFTQGGSVLCASAANVLTIRGCNVQQPKLQLQRVYPNNLVRALQRQDLDTLAPAEALPLAAPNARNEVWTLDVDLTKFANAPLRGLYCATLQHSTAWWERDRRWLQITDLGITWRQGVESALVQVVDLVSGEPVAGAQITVLTPTNQELLRATTDGQGLAMVRWTEQPSDRKPFVVLAQRGDDVAFAACADKVELADEDLGGAPWAGDAPEAWVWPTRGIVRPGETLDVALLVRDAAGLPRPDLVATALLRGPSQRVLQRLPLPLNGSGLGHVAFAMPIDGATGEHTLEVVTQHRGDERTLGRATVQVDAFVPDRLEVEVVDVTPLRFGQPGTVRVRGRWLEGAPAAGRRVAARVRLLAQALQFPRAEGFTFASAMQEAPPGELPAVAGTLDAQGEAELVFGLPMDAAQQGLLAHVAIELEDPSGRVVRAARSVPVHRADHHLGLRARPGGVDLRALDADGDPLVRELAATVRHEVRRWVWRHVHARDGRWHWRTESVATTLGEWNVVLRDGAATLDLPSRGDDQFVVVTCGSRAIELALGAPLARPDRLRVQTPSEPVASGGMARLVVTSPAAGRGLVTFESDRLHGACVVALQRGETTLDVPVPPNLQLPNVHAVVTLTRPATQSGPDLGPAWLIGGAALRLARPELASTLRLDAPSEVLPDGEWHGVLHAPGAATALVALVDEGVLRITGHADPDPLAFLLRRRALTTFGIDSGSALLQGMKFAPGSKTGGDGGDDSGLLVGSIDNRIRPYVRFQRVDLDALGRGDVRFALEGYEGRVRAMAIAAGAPGIATAAAATVVRAPLGLRLALPRMVVPGDRFTVPVTVRNDVAAGPVVVTLAVEGALRLLQADRHEPTLALGGETTIDVPVVALTPAPGESLARLVVLGTVGTQTRRVVADCSVRTPALREQMSIGVDLVGGGELAIDDSWQQVQARVRVDARPDPLLGPVVERLFKYPYGCVEQTTSVANGLLACRTMLARWYGAEDPRVVAAPGMLELAVHRLLDLQSYEGHFGWWGGGSGEPWLTAYATDFLIAAREQGIAVPEDALARSLDVLAASLRSSTEPAVACQVLDVLARAGRPVQPWLDWVCTQPLAVDDRLRLAMVCGRLGLLERGKALLGNDSETAVRAPADRDLASPLRSRALRLRARLRLDPRDPRLPELALGLQRAIQAQRNATTHENAHCVMALAEYYGQLPTPEAGTEVRVVVDGKPVAIDGAPIAVRAGSSLTFAAGGRGFAIVELNGLRRPFAAAPSERGLRLTRTLIDVDTGLPVQRCRRGGLYEVRVRLEAEQALAQVVVVDLLPGGLEAERTPTARAVANDDDERRPRQQKAGPVVVDATRCERRDDRVVLFFDQLGRDSEVRYRVRATFPGSWQRAPLHGEAMYDPDVLCEGMQEPALEIDP